MAVLYTSLFIAAVFVILAMILRVAPTPTARSTPSTTAYMDEGYPTFITLSNIPTIPLREIEVTPIGTDNGEPINITTQWNAAKVTKSPRALNTDDDISVKVGYATQAIPLIRAQVGKKQTITLTHPDGSTDAVFGYVRSFKPDGYKVGDMPVATVVIVVMNWDWTAHAEQPPVFAQGAGTGGA